MPRPRSRVAVAATAATALVLPLLAAPPAVALPARTALATSTLPHDVEIADVDRDGVPDLLVAGWGEDVWPPLGVFAVHRGNGDGTFGAAEEVVGGQRAYDVDTGDIDGDGDLDAIVARDFQTVSVMVNDGGGGFTQAADHTVGTYISRAAVLADTDGDGWLDIVASDWGVPSPFPSRLTISRNNGDGTFAPYTSLPLGDDRMPSTIVADDIDDDGDVDLLVAPDGANWDLFRNDGTGDFADRTTFSTTPTYAAPGLSNIVTLSISSMAVADMDRDGWKDVLLGFTNDTRHGFWILPGNGDGSFDDHARYSVFDGVNALDVGDVDGDGMLDVVAVATDHPYRDQDNVYVVGPGRSSGFPTSTFTTVTAGNRPQAVAVGDLDGDWLADAVTADQLSSTLSVFVTPPPPPPPGEDPTVQIWSPEDGSSYEQGAEVYAQYWCDDPDGSIATCDGPVPDGALIDTSTPGPQSFEVVATDDSGATGTGRSDYTVTPGEAPSIEITVPADGQTYRLGDPVYADYLCDDGTGVGVLSCEGDVGVYQDINTSALGEHTFTVDAVDRAGNAGRRTVTYTVAEGDTDGPEIRLVRPEDGAVYAQNAVVPALYECTDAAGQVTSCQGTVPSGQAINTATVGSTSFSVSAEDDSGNWASAYVQYWVTGDGLPPTDTTAPYVRFGTPMHLERYALGGEYVVDYSCVDYGSPISGIASCTGSVPNGSVLDTSQLGFTTVTVTAVDNAGNRRSQYVEYEVIEDSDRDGLRDVWETDGVDIDGDGVVDLSLPGADPQRKDMYLEMDWMTCQLSPGGCPVGDRTSHRPQDGVVDDAVQAFAAAPVENPDGSTGITLHYLLDEAVPEIPTIRWYRGPGDYDDVEDVKAGPAGSCNGAFGTAAERDGLDCEKVLKAKNLVYRWGLFGHAYSEWYGSSGIAEYPGNDFIVTVGGFADSWERSAGSLRIAEAATVMHEFGHNLALGHGGPSDNVNCKPNYLSVMNYSLTMPYYDPDAPLDYSRSRLPDLDESALDEAVGVQGPAGRNTVYGAGYRSWVAPADGPIDWNRDGTITGPVAANVNATDQCSSGDSEVLKGADDWTDLQYGFSATQDFASGSRFSSDVLLEEEVTAEQALTAAESTDADGDGVSNAADVCPGVADPSQADLDQDGVGDACDPENAVEVRVFPEKGPTVSSKHKFVQVALLATPRLAATDVDTSTLRFGVGTSSVPTRSCSRRDVDGDKRADVLCLYPVKGSGLTVGTSLTVLRGATRSGALLRGTASVTMVR